MSYNEKTDIWSCGCLFYKLFAKENLFVPEEFEDIDKDEDHIAQIFEVVHEIDSSFINSSSKKKVRQMTEIIRNFSRKGHWSLKISQN